MPSQKHFLDTSVLHACLLGIMSQKQYFNEAFGDDPCYVSNFVIMEFTRSHILNLAEFYFDLSLPNIKNCSDAIKFWSNKFESGKMRALLQFISDILTTHVLDYTDPKHKETLQELIAEYIKRILIIARSKFRDIGVDSTRCARANVSLNLLDSSIESLIEFVENFKDVDSHREQCRITNFFLNKHKDVIDIYTSQSSSLPSNRDTKGFKEIVKKLNLFVDRGLQAGSCNLCRAIGDAVIALDAPRDMRLEHVDRSFNYLCPPINQPHFQHPSATELVNK